MKAAFVRIAPQFVIGDIPWYEDEDKAIAELKLYLSSATSFIPSENPEVFWNRVAVHFPRLFDIDSICLSFSVNSLDERSFSLYSDVLRDNPRSTEECILPVYNLLHQNDV